MLQFRAINNTNPTDARTCEVEAAVAPHYTHIATEIKCGSRPLNDMQFLLRYSFVVVVVVVKCKTIKWQEHEICIQRLVK
jgi:hypothetical protein